MAGSNIHANVKVSFAVAAGAAVADFDGCLWTADMNYELIEACERHGTAGAAANITVVKVPTGTAKSAGTNMLSTAGFSAAGTANTPVFISKSTTQANTRLARGDSIGVELSAASAALDAVSVTVYLKTLSQLG